MPEQASLLLVSHKLCPYVQRAVIALLEKRVAFERRDIDLAAKPDWFLELSPTGKTPLLVVADEPVFESNAILEYLEDTQSHPLHPADPLKRAKHRGWLEFASAILNDIGGLYNAETADAHDTRIRTLVARFARLEADLGDGPYFDAGAFSLVDAAFAPVFRYFDVFEVVSDLDVFTGLPKTAAWRSQLAARPSVQRAVSDDYHDHLLRFLRNRPSILGERARSMGTRG